MNLVNNLEMNRLQTLNRVIQKLAAPPASPVEGLEYYDTVVHAAFIWDGTIWVPTDPRKAPTGSIPNTALTTDPLARANHTGSQTSSTISDFDTAVRSSRLDQMAAPTADVSLNSRKITSLAPGVAGTDGANVNQVNAAKAYADTLVAGLIDDRGSYDASGNTFPGSGGSGAAGAILKGDLWYISVAGTLGGVAVKVGDSVRALVDTPGQTAGNWDILGTNIGFVPENVANKTNDITLATDSATKYPSEHAVKGYVAAAVTGVGRTAAALIGDGSSTSITVTHNLATRDIIVSVAEAATPYGQVWPDIRMPTVNTVALDFAVAPATNKYRVSIVGVV